MNVYFPLNTSTTQLRWCNLRVSLTLSLRMLDTIMATWNSRPFLHFSLTLTRPRCSDQYMSASISSISGVMVNMWPSHSFLNEWFMAAFGDQFPANALSWAEILF